MSGSDRHQEEVRQVEDTSLIVKLALAVKDQGCICLVSSPGQSCESTKYIDIEELGCGLFGFGATL